MIVAVFDCVVYVQAAISKQGPAGVCLSFVEDGQVKLFVRETLSKQKLRQRFPHLTDERVELFLQRMAQIAEVLHDVPGVFSLQRDPDDAKYVDLAAASAASFLVTRDHDLRSLMDDAKFLKSYPGLSILEPPAFLSHLRNVIAKDLGYEKRMGLCR